MRIQNRFILQCGTDAIAHFLAAPLEENRRWNFLAAKIFNHQLPFPAERRGKWDRKRRDAAIKQKFFLLLTGRGLHSQGRRRSHSRGVVVIVPVSGRKIGSPRWHKGYRIPGNGSAGAFFAQMFTIEICRRLDAAGVRVPLRDRAFGERHVHRYCFFPRVIKIQDRRFHSDSAAQPKFETGIAKVFDEGRKARGPSERRPFDGLPVAARNRGKGTPFVGRQTGVDRYGILAQGMGRDRKTDHKQGERIEDR